MLAPFRRLNRGGLGTLLHFLSLESRQPRRLRPNCFAAVQRGQKAATTRLSLEAHPRFCYLSRSYRLAITAQQIEPLRFDGHRFYLRRDVRTGASDHFRRWYVCVGKEWLEKRIRVLARKTGCRPTEVEVRDLGFRWGSCSRSGVVLLNWRLLQLPVRLADYVIVHELTHLIEPHHRPAFWRALDHALPDWRDRKEELRTKAQEVNWCQPAMMQ